MVLSIGYFYLEEFQTAKEIILRAMQTLNNMGVQVFKSGIYSIFVLVETELGNFNSTQDYAEECLSFTQKFSERLFEGLSWTVLGRLLGKKEPAEFNKAEEYIRKGIDLLDEIECRSILSWGYFYLGDLYNDMGRKDEAVRTLKMAKEMLKEMGIVYYLNKTQKLLERI